MYGVSELTVTELSALDLCVKSLKSGVILNDTSYSRIIPLLGIGTVYTTSMLVTPGLIVLITGAAGSIYGSKN